VRYGRSVEPYDISFLFFVHVGSLDLLIDKQQLIRNNVLAANSLCANDTMDVSLRRQFKDRISRFREKREAFGSASIALLVRRISAYL